MKTIYKYRLEIADTQIIDMPEGAEILCIQMQEGAPHIWAMVDTDKPAIEKVCIVTFGTGHEITGLGLTYIGTYQIYARGLVFHVFESPI